MQANQTQLHRGTTAPTEGDPVRLSGTILLQAFLSAAGGTATCNVYGRLSGGPWVLLWTAGLSGANDQESYILDNEPWYEIKGNISAIGGGATAVVAGAY